MASDRFRMPPEPDEDAYEDAWYRALKAKAARRFVDPREEQVEPLPPESSPSKRPSEPDPSDG
jgi:hypothetical protein